VTPAQSGQDRIDRIRSRYRTATPRICLERARHLTEKWRDPSLARRSPAVRAAGALRHVFQNMTLYLDPDDRIAGTWCECFLGTPLDIERGLYNGVLAAESGTLSLLRFRVHRLGRFLAYALVRGGLGSLAAGRRSGATGPVPVDLSLKTLSARSVNPFFMTPGDRRTLRRVLLPYWRGRTAAERVQRAIRGARLFSRDVREFLWAMDMPPSRQVTVVAPTAAVCTYQGHLVPDLRRALERGLLGMREDVRARRRESAGRPADERDTLESMEIALDGAIVFARRLADAVRDRRDRESDPGRRRELTRMLDSCRHAPLHPAENFPQALQAVWTVKCVLDIAHPTNVQSVGRLDQLLGPYYEKDLAAGLLTRAQALEGLQELLLKIMSHNIRPESNLLGDFYLRFEGSEPVTLGGLTPAGADATNEVTFLLLEAAERSRAVTNVVLRIHPETPEAVHLALADALYRGASNISVMNDTVQMEALRARGASVQDARDYAVTGCTDVLCPGKTGGLSISGLMLCRVLDITLRGGELRTLAGTVRRAGPATGDPDAFGSFHRFLEAFHTQAAYCVQRIVEASNIRDRVFADHFPAPFLSAFVDGPLASRRDVTRGGAVYDMSLINMINSVANAVDGLLVIQRLVYEEKRLTAAALRRALDDNFSGHPEIERMIRGVKLRWGNGSPEADDLARAVTSRLFEASTRHRAFRGGPWGTVVNSMTSHTIDGRLSAATPDGRKAATPYASSCNPYNVERCGVTGVLRSVAALDFRNVLGCSVNIRLHPSAIGGSLAARRKWMHLLRAYFRMGGPQLQPTVASAETLREALRDPHAHAGLLVKVGGYSAYFTELGREIQEEVIQRTEHGAP